jgi:GAF domain-containing protein/two-component sensor histidine kinase
MRPRGGQTTTSTVARPRRTASKFQRQLDELAAELRTRTAERDEAFAQQAATAEILQVINSSPGTLAPVFNAILEKAHTLCEATYGSLQIYDGEMLRAVAVRGLSDAFADLLRRGFRASDSPFSRRLLEGEDFVHILDAFEIDHPLTRSSVELSGIRTTLVVPLRKDDVFLGSIVAARKEVRAFSDKQIAWLQSFAAHAAIAMENARLLGELRERTDDLEEALKYQTATSDVLKVISRSTFNLQPVLDTLADTAARLCNADGAALTVREGEIFRYASAYGTSPEFASFLRQQIVTPDRGSLAGRIALEGRVVHVTDVTADPEYTLSETIKIGKMRVLLGAPLLRDGAVVGALMLHRCHVEPFAQRQIELVQTFADQAVIAIENARLLSELLQSLEYQTATSDVLKVISRSAFDLHPVLGTLIETAARLCSAEMALVSLREGEVYRMAANYGYPAEFESFLRSHAVGSDRGTMIGRAALDRKVVHVADVAADPEYRMPEAITIGRARTSLGVPLLREGQPIGVIVLARERVEPFTERQIDLVRTFADQAVIAIENTRLLTETHEALKQQTATAEVLQVINASPGNLTPVFEAMLDKALALCDGRDGLFWSFHGDQMRVEAARGHIATIGEYFAVGRTYPIGATNAQARLIRGEPYVHILDVAGDYAYRAGDEIRRLTIEVFGVHTLLAVPLRKEGTCIGAFVIDRTEVKPFTDRQIALLESFAAQAVIAMENVRLFGELRQRTDDLEESLKYQTATSDVLKVISGSAFDLQPVLDTVVETAAHLCDADFAGITLRDGDVYRYVALTASTSPEYVVEVRGRAFERGRGSVAGRVALDGKVVHVADITADPEYDYAAAVNIGKIRTLLGVPMFREGEVVGVIGLSRQRVQPFTERQIELVRTFADQAVIAIENARLLTETREALEQQTATTGVLQVINASPGNLTPVFETMLDKALRLCDASFGTMQRNDNGHFYMLACRNVPAPFEEFLSRPMRALSGGSLDRLLHGEAFVQIVDVREGAQSTTGRRALVELAQARTVVWIPLRKDSAVLGTFVIYRTEVKSFSDKQIALLQNFAAQAVIAMDNARLLGELRERQAELRVTFDNMGDGVALFDSTPRLVAWNRNFQQILDLPDALLEQHLTYPEYIRMLADRGEFGALENMEEELERRLVSIDRPALFARTRPDGKVIEARRNPVPGGGFVLIYSDITERKRAEAEISAARDAAEKALRELQAAQASLLHSQKMAALGQLTAGIAHEIKNPLNFVNNFADLSVELLDDLKAAAAPLLSAATDRAEIDDTMEMLTSNLAKIAEHGRRADGIVRSMLAHSRGGGGDRQAVDLNALIEESLNLAYHGARAQDQNFNITLEREFDPAIKLIELVPQDITRVFLNLFGNGFYAANKRARTYADGHFRPVLRVATHDAGDAVEIRVRDNGGGIPAEIRDKLFQPFFTTKPTGEGTGLGLSISYDIVTQQHGGAIAVDSEEGVFTEFTVRLPRGGRALQAKGLS